MKITALRLFNVKRFAGRGVAIEGIGEGVNVFCAVNEYGKSSSFEALHALFFQPHSSVSAEVRNLRPYSGGNPLIEVDVSTAKGRFRITKQYYGGRSARVADLVSGRLIAQADEAENFIARLLQGGQAGPAGLLWVRQGVTGIEARRPKVEEGEAAIRRSLLESVQGEVEAVTGGRRMAEVVGATQQALDELVTPAGKPKAGGRYAVAVAEHERLAGEERQLAGEVAALRDALKQRITAAKRLAELDNADERAGRRKAVAMAEARLDLARSQNDRQKSALSELELFRERYDGAERELKAYRAALEGAQALRDKLCRAARHRDGIADNRRAAAEAVATARAIVEKAETDEIEARNLLMRLDAALKAREAAQRHAELRKRLESAIAIRQSLEAGEAKLVLLNLPATDVEDLQALEIEIAGLRAIAEADRPTVMVDYDPAAAGSVILNDMPLGQRQAVGFDGQARLVVPGIGAIIVHAHGAGQDKDRLAKSQARRQALLRSLGVADLAEARALQVQAQELAASLGELRGSLSQLAPHGLQRLQEEVAVLAAADSDTLELPADPKEIRTALTEAEGRLQAARQTLREAEPLRQKVDETFVAAETALAALKSQQAHLEAILGPETQREDRHKALVRTLADMERLRSGAEILIEGLRAAGDDLETAEAGLRRVRSADQAAEQEINQLRETIAGLNAEIRTRADEAVEEKWREVSEALTAASARMGAFAREVAVLRRLASALEAARLKARDLYLKPVLSELTPLLGLLFDDVSVVFDDRTLLPHAIRRNGQEEDVERLSGGMREQLSVLTRLAFARLLARDGRPAPVVLDDALVYSDDDRIEKMFDALHRQSGDQQIIVFSCRQRAFRKLGGNVLQMIDWQP